MYIFLTTIWSLASSSLFLHYFWFSASFIILFLLVINRTIVYLPSGYQWKYFYSLFNWFFYYKLNFKKAHIIYFRIKWAYLQFFLCVPDMNYKKEQTTQYIIKSYLFSCRSHEPNNYGCWPYPDWNMQMDWDVDKAPCTYKNMYEDLKKEQTVILKGNKMFFSV